MTDAHAAVAEFLTDFSGAATALPDDADIFDRLGIDGDDGFELIERFATKISQTIVGTSTTARKQSMLVGGFLSHLIGE